MIRSFIRETDEPSAIEKIKIYASLTATVIGLAVIAVGLFYAIYTLGLIFSVLKDPDTLHQTLSRLAESIGGEAFSVTIARRPVPTANLIALSVYCGGVLVLGWLTLGMMQTGAKIVSWTAGDREAVKALLTHVFGDLPAPSDKPSKNRSKSDIP